VKILRIAIAVLVSVRAVLPAVATAQTTTGSMEETIPPGENFDKAEFRLWVPDVSGPVRAIVVLVPGSNGDGRAMADDPEWRAFAVRHSLALLACRFTDKPHDQNFIEHYVNVSQGSGQALLDALAAFAARAKHPELATAPFLMWGMSAGGQFNYEFVAWKPERVAAFVVNKGGIYYSALLSPAARSVPGILFIGGKDLEFRNNTIAGLFAVNRRAGALWALAEEPGVAHVVGRSRDVAMMFYEDVLPLRLGANGTSSLQPMVEKAGLLGDLKAHTARPLDESGTPNYPTAWLPTARVARAWEAMATEKPF
jgi:poly(3-hydroxybutyrate) depolymerase